MAIEKIGDILLKARSVTKEELDYCFAIQKGLKTDEKIGKILRYFNFTTDKEIACALAYQVGWKYFDKKYVIDLETIDGIGLEFFKQESFVPVRTDEGLAFVFAHPFAVAATDCLSKYGLSDKDCYVGSENQVRYHLDCLSNRKKAAEIEKKIGLIKEQGLIGNELKELADALLDEAIIQGASDIHIEPEEKISTVRFRIDGMLYFRLAIRPDVHNNLVNIIFSKADITVSDFLKFHDARFQHNYSNHAVDVRVSCIPSSHGPALVLRLLDVTRSLITLEQLGFDRTHFDCIRRIAQKPHGIIIMAGPTGSGKTTTLYAILNELKSVSTKVITIEDPVEIKMPLVNQVQINEKQGITFAGATRAFLRHDPNIILIGEIRDRDTAQEAIRAAITGHRVLSTLHTNTAVDSIYRLHDLGVDLPYISNSILAVISQRLIRKLCSSCKKKVTVKKEKWPAFFKEQFKEDKSEIRAYKAVGCDHCQAGYKGRTVIAEILEFDPEIKSIVASGRLESLHDKERQKSRLDLGQDAARLILCGVTSFEEAERIIG
ncbi:type IV fimbrial assembly, ATPase PilB [Candidatus Velamenicoccus archaeovorus]|uniref:Type IV fimbrial assembly, ATPase PilB n=1 Tax=Velamenicoccus archaeovorus TaxID=1930593 RepID=A0A410P3N3_VELA1|nr:GspE/PulE family protein [Candidatus Velamenicoccus archaeovorus]QAT16688.1 type IV fimbrial assembly, ATPase PilB [Candidatus Velamenicoccus archaeovorus]